MKQTDLGLDLSTRHLDGQKGAFAEGEGISTSANSQGAASQLKSHLEQPELVATGDGVSSCETYSLVAHPQDAF